MSYVCSSALVHLYLRLLPLLLQTPSEQCSNSALYWSSQIIGGLAISYVCDLPTYTTRHRGCFCWTLLFGFGNCVMIWGKVFEDDRAVRPAQWIVFGQEGYFAPAALYFSYGLVDALWQGVSDRVISLPSRWVYAG